MVKKPGCLIFLKNNLFGFYAFMSWDTWKYDGRKWRSMHQILADGGLKLPVATEDSAFLYVGHVLYQES